MLCSTNRPVTTQVDYSAMESRRIARFVWNTLVKYAICQYAHDQARQMVESISTMVIMKILTVCLGNICRSPAAESVLIHELEKAGINAEVASAGTSDWHIGNGAHELTQKVGTERGYEFVSVADQITAAHLDEADLVLAMDDSNLSNILALTENAEQRAKIVRFGAFASDVDEAGIANVPDPYGHPEDAYVSMYDQIEDAARGLVSAIQNDSLDTVLQQYGGQ